MSTKIISDALSRVPWEAKPEGGVESPVWRYSQNPIIGRNPVKGGVSRIFNSAVAFHEGKFVGVFRAEGSSTRPFIHFGTSEDAIHWNIEEERINFVDEEGKAYQPNYAYDPRLVKVEDTFYVIWCTDFYGASIGMAKTVDFKTYVKIENPPFIPFNRNAVLFPRKIDGKFMMLSRPSDSGHTPFGDIFVSESYDLTYWGGKHRHIMAVVVTVGGNQQRLVEALHQ